MKVTRANFCVYSRFNPDGSATCPYYCELHRQHPVECAEAQKLYNQYLLKELNNKKEKTVNYNKNVNVKKVKK